MRRRLTTILFAVTVSVLALSSFFVHLSGDLRRPRAASSAAAAAAIVGGSAYPRSSHAVREILQLVSRRLAPPPLAAVLLPDWEALLLLPPISSAAAATAEPLSCLFHNGASSPARLAAGGGGGGGAAAFASCALPRSVRRLRPFHAPRLIGAADAPIPRSEGPDRPAEMIRWSPLAYDAISTPDDVVVFAKGVNTRQGASRPAADLLCVFSDSGAVVAAVAAASSAQEVFRCPHPPPEALSRTFSHPLRISLGIAPDYSDPIPSVANYRPPRVPAHGEPSKNTTAAPRSLVCACTMVYNAAKFLREWVAYHAAVGVDRFYVYDNGSDDGLGSAVDRLVSEGFHVSARYWPWPKAQEAGFSHCAAVTRAECEWMAFIDVDEFVFSPNWAGSARPARSMLRSVVSVPPSVGQVSIGCHVFGPSGQTAHPKSGVTQGYTCRQLAEERHKSLVRLDAVDRSLVNSVHHFGLREGFRTAKARSVRVNHYKYQAWDEFKLKFRRRASTYVTDWTDTAKAGSRDRTPGLGFEAVEPAGWSQKFCEMNDTRLKNTSQKWFGAVGPGGEYKMAWE